MYELLTPNHLSMLGSQKKEPESEYCLKLFEFLAHDVLEYQKTPVDSYRFNEIVNIVQSQFSRTAEDPELKWISTLLLTKLLKTIASVDNLMLYSITQIYRYTHLLLNSSPL